ncbi:hypothetical protein PINS_up023841 [Pythium insidiosum]|nr:hypothetical protein PINS_up023841 [Pythium insidiosum]
MIVQAAPSLHAYRWLLWFAFYASAIAVHVAGDRVFWTVNRLLALVSLAVLALYVFGSICFADYKTYAAGDASLLVIGGFPAFLKALPLCCWFFVGVEALNLASDHVKEPKRSIPRAQITCVSTLAVSGIAVVLVTVSLAPDCVCCPTRAALLVSFAPSLSDYLFNVCILSAFMSYTGQCIGYISLKRSYKNITSSAFRSPFGVAGAVYSMAVWALAIVSIVAFQGHGGVEIGAFAGVVALLSV